MDPRYPLLGTSAQEGFEFLGHSDLGEEKQWQEQNYISFPQSPVTYGIYYTPLTRTSRSLKYGPELSSWPNCSPAYNTCSRKARAPYSLPLQPGTAFPSFSLLFVTSTPQDCWLYRSTLNSSFSRTGLPKLPTTPNLAPAKHGQLRALLVKNLLLENFFQKYWNNLHGKNINFLVFLYSHFVAYCCTYI